MAFGRAKSPEEQAEKAAQKAAEEEAKALKEFQEGPVGKARAAFEAGNELFQISMPVMDQTNFFISAKQRSTDPSTVLNAICAEGWELVNGSFVFAQTGAKSTDKLVMSGQWTEVKGNTTGYYLFRRKAS